MIICTPHVEVLLLFYKFAIIINLLAEVEVDEGEVLSQKIIAQVVISAQVIMMANVIVGTVCQTVRMIQKMTVQTICKTNEIIMDEMIRTH
jgi:hypothetical protein